MGYLAHYGYADGSGEYFISIDSGKCDGCGKCVSACAERVFEIVLDDYDERVAVVREGQRRKVRFSCAGCKPIDDRRALACESACAPRALQHSW